MYKKILGPLAALALLAGGLSGASAPAVAAISPVPVVKDVSLSALKPPTAAPKTSHANTAKAKTVKSTTAAHKVPNAGGITTQATTACASWPTSACYNYAGMLQNFTTTKPTGAYANLMIPWSYTDYPARDAGAHSVNEVAVINKRANNNRDIVEWGLISDRTMSPTSNDEPRVFAFAWVNGVPQGYNNGFVNYTGANNCGYHPTDSMGAVNGTASAWGVEYINTPGTAVGWWTSINSKWCGYFPADSSAGSTAGNLWYESGATIQDATQVQWFGEVTSQFNEPCTDMASGTFGSTNPGGSYSYATWPGYWSSAAYAPVGFAAANVGLFNTPTGTKYDTRAIGTSNRGVYYGGPGWNSAATGTGTRGSC